ncbi:MAG: hypothetical protein ABSA90_01830 [Xanthobacteraceae bacterium]|jgi:hypothetical protein
MVEKVTVEQGMVGFDYNAEAELFPSRKTVRPRGGRHPLRDRGAAA